jgi:hypothetical protein
MLHAVRDGYERQRARLSLHRRLAPSVPPKRMHAFRRAVEWLFPWRDAYPGFYIGVCAVCECTLPRLKHWLAGRRAIPTSVRLRLIEAIRARLESGHAVLAELEAMQDPVKESPVVRIQRARARRLEKERALDKP